MTLTELAKKHDIDPDSVIAFLREWLDAQPSYPVDRKHGDVCVAIFKNTELRKGDMLIARPTLGE